jgi:hypothetical protein
MTDQTGPEAIARKAVQTSPDRMRNRIELDGESVDLAPQATLAKAKAQWSDALWLLMQLSRKAWLQRAEQIESVTCSRCGASHDFLLRDAMLGMHWCTCGAKVYSNGSTDWNDRPTE